MDLKEEAAIGGDPAGHWYYISKARAIKTLIRGRRARRLLDVGAGSGVFSSMLVAEGAAVEATCVDPNYTDAWLAARNRAGAPVRYVRAAGDGGCDLVLMIDVIEHVDDDVGLIAHYAEAAPPGARFVISAPAFPFLWSSHDDFLDHRRRYTRGSLGRVVRAAGLIPVTERYFFGLLFPFVAASRLTDRIGRRGEVPRASALKPAPGWLNAALVAAHDVERRVMFPVNRFAGVTAFCLAEKRAAEQPLRAAA